MARKTALTPKQQEVLTLAEQGMTADQAADKLGIAVSGIYNHTKRIRGHGHKIEWLKASEAAAGNGGSTAPAPAAAAPPQDDHLGHSIEQFTAFLEDLRSQRGERHRLIEEYEGEIERLQTGIETAREEIATLDGQIEQGEKVAAELDEFGASTVAAT